MIWFLLIVAAIVGVTWVFLRGEELAQYDLPPGQRFTADGGSNEARDNVVASLGVGLEPVRRAPRRQRLALMREHMDSISETQDYHAAITEVDAAGVPAEWVMAPGTDPSRRVLYIHGGAFVMGSPRSHRNITSKFSAVANAAVLAIDYRLMPEHRRIHGIEDCRTAYRWIVEHGPDGHSAPTALFVGGDSAGGNLTLSLIAWVRDQPSLRQPDAAVALSPVTDLTLGSPSLKENMETDAMLAPMFRGLARIPRPILWWVALLQNRITPRNPVISPVFGDLSGLPPTLVHASESELLVDDGRRYVNRAVASGSVARLQTWPDMVHVWHMFHPQLPEANAAWTEIESFLAEHDGTQPASQGETGA